MRRACTKKFISRNRTFNAEVRSVKLEVNVQRRSSPTKIEGMWISVLRKRVGMVKRIVAHKKWIKLERIMDSGMTAFGNLAFLMSARSLTIEGVPFVRDNEKKFHTRSPIKR